VGSLFIFGHYQDVFVTIGTLINFLLFVPLPALFVRRLHDQGRSGWWVLLCVVPWAISLTSPPGQEPSILLQSIGVLSAIAIIGLALWKGNEGENVFGPNPRLSED
jgi:uncharacterized membrane protein YhaH (DUF805 family)